MQASPHAPARTHRRPHGAPAMCQTRAGAARAQVRLLRLNDAANMFGDPGAADRALRLRLERLQVGAADVHVCVCAKTSLGCLLLPLLGVPQHPAMHIYMSFHTSGRGQSMPVSEPMRA